MKKVNVFFAGVFILLLSLSLGVQAQEGNDFFTGKWDVMVTGTPNGDSQMLLTIESVDEKLSGTISLDEQSEPQALSSIAASETSLSVNFFASGYDVSISLKKVDADNLEGSMMGMFNAKGVRNKE